jgi:type IV pilus assembly protein PilV
MPTTVKPNAGQRGATLLEALIGILIFSVGILALVGMQSLAIRHMADARYRSEASFLANEIIGGMWVNKGNLASYAYGGSGSPPAAIANWVTNIQSTLPGVTAGTNLPSIDLAGSRVTVTVRWQLPGATEGHQHITVAYINW